MRERTHLERTSVERTSAAAIEAFGAHPRLPSVGTSLPVGEEEVLPMKVTVEIDCTPDEARQFFGLPDLKPLQGAVLAQLEKQMLDATAAFSSPDALLRSWLTLLPQGPDQMREMFTRFFPMRGSGGSD
jgi:methylaspartate ammonia-lyase